MTIKTFKFSSLMNNIIRKVKNFCTIENIVNEKLEFERYVSSALEDEEYSDVFHKGEIPVVLASPIRFDDAIEIVDCIHAGSIVVMNAENFSVDEKRRLIDFCAGGASASCSLMERIGSDTFIFGNMKVKRLNFSVFTQGANNHAQEDEKQEVSTDE